MTEYKQLPLPFPSEIVYIPLSKRGKNAGIYEAIVDVIDSDLAEYNWSVELPKKQHWAIYAKRNIFQNASYYKLRLHTIIMERILARSLIEGEQCDHINGNGLDNRRSNLRLATQQENKRNRRLYSNNTSGYKGACWDKKANKYRATIGIHGKQIVVGYFDTPEEAHAAYCEAAEKYHGEFANTGE